MPRAFSRSRSSSADPLAALARLEQLWTERQARSAEVRRCMAALPTEQAGPVAGGGHSSAFAPYHDGQQANFTATIVLATACAENWRVRAGTPT